MAGPLKIIGSFNLKGLGANEGPGVTYVWAPGGWPKWFPWFAIVALLLLKPNRTTQAWRIWFSIAGVIIVALGVKLLPGAGAEALQAISQIIQELGLALAGLWLLSPWLVGKRPSLTFMKTVLAFTALSLAAQACYQDWTAGRWEIVGTAIAVVISAMAITVAVALSRWRCRREFRAFPFALTVLAWLAVTVIVFTIGMLGCVSGIRDWADVLTLALLFTALVFTVLLPFLLLSFGNDFYGCRLKALLHLEPPESAAHPLVTSAPHQSL